MNVRLKPEIQKYVKDKVRHGQYTSTDEAVNDLLAHARQQEEMTPAEQEELAAEIDVAISQANKGEFKEFTAQTVINDLHQARTTPKKHR